MSDTTYKVVTKVNVMLQIEVQPFSTDCTMKQIKDVAIRDAAEIVGQILKASGMAHRVAICGELDVLSILVKEAKP